MKSIFILYWKPSSRIINKLKLVPIIIKVKELLYIFSKVIWFSTLLLSIFESSSVNLQERKCVPVCIVKMVLKIENVEQIKKIYVTIIFHNWVEICKIFSKNILLIMHLNFISIAIPLARSINSDMIPLSTKIDSS